MGWPTSRGLVSDWSQINIQHSAVDSGCRFDRPFQRIGPQIVIYLLMVLGLGTPASAHRVDTFAIDGNLVPAPGVIRDAEHQYHQKVNNNLGLYSLWNGLSN